MNNKERELNITKMAFKTASEKFSQLEIRSKSIDTTAIVNNNNSKHRRFSDFIHLKWCKTKEFGKWQPKIETPDGLDISEMTSQQQVFNNNIRRISLQHSSKYEQSNMRLGHLCRKYSNESYFGPGPDFSKILKKKSSITLLVLKKNENFLTTLSDSDIHASKENLNLLNSNNSFSSSSTITGETLSAVKINNSDDDETN